MVIENIMNCQRTARQMRDENQHAKNVSHRGIDCFAKGSYPALQGDKKGIVNFVDEP